MWREMIERLVWFFYPGIPRNLRGLLLGYGQATLARSLKFYRVNQEDMRVKDHRSLPLDAQFSGRRVGAAWSNAAHRCSGSSRSSNVLSHRLSPPAASHIPYVCRISSSISATPLRYPHVQGGTLCISVLAPKRIARPSRRWQLGFRCVVQHPKRAIPLHIKSS